MNRMNKGFGEIIRVAGPVVGAIGLDRIRLFDVVQVGEMGLIGEVIRLDGNITTIQVYEDTSGIRVGEPVSNTH
jgi:V/A-type H+-transporting ATPase subunit A